MQTNCCSGATLEAEAVRLREALRAVAKPREERRTRREGGGRNSEMRDTMLRVFPCGAGIGLKLRALFVAGPLIASQAGIVGCAASNSAASGSSATQTAARQNPAARPSGINWREDKSKSPVENMKAMMDTQLSGFDPSVAAGVRVAMATAGIEAILSPTESEEELTLQERVEMLRFFVELGNGTTLALVPPEMLGGEGLVSRFKVAQERAKAAIPQLEDSIRQETLRAASAHQGTLQSELAAVEKLLEDQSLDAATRATLEAEAVRLREALRPVAKP